MSGLLSLVNSRLPLKSFKALMFKWSEGVLFFVFVLDAVNSRRKAELLLAVACAASFLVACDSLFQFFKGEDFIFGHRLMFNYQKRLLITGPFRHYNDLGAYMASLFFIALGLFARARRIPVKAILAGLLFLTLTVSFLTFSRSSWLGLFAGFFFFFWNISRSRKYYTILFFLFFAGLFLCMPAIRNRIFFTFTFSWKLQRLELWKAALAMAKEHPFFGIGIGTFMDRLKDYSCLSGQYAHNSFLQILAEQGVVGLGSIAAFLWVLFIRAWKAIKSGGDILYAGVFSSLAAFSVCAFFDTHLYSLRLSALFWLLCGLLAAFVRIGRNQMSASLSR